MKKKLFSFISAVVFSLCLAIAPAMACDGPDCSASGNFEISTFAAGGGVDCALETIPNGVAGGVGAAGGISVGEAEGSFVGNRRFSLGNAGADLHSVAGGFTNTEDYIFNPNPGSLGIGVGSSTETYAITTGFLHVEAKGLAYSAGEISGIAGQGSLNSSLIGPSPLCCWDSEGFSTGLAGQGSVGGFAGGAIAAGLGSTDIEAGIEMSGISYSESYRGINFDGDYKTEYMGTNVGAYTTVTSYKGIENNCFATGCIDGGFIANGSVSTLTFQSTDNGLARASAVGSYTGSGNLGCNFNGSAVGYTQTSVTTLQGYSGSVMSSSAGMNVSSGSNNGIN